MILNSYRATVEHTVFNERQKCLLFMNYFVRIPGIMCSYDIHTYELFEFHEKEPGLKFCMRRKEKAALEMKCFQPSYTRNVSSSSFCKDITAEVI